MRHSFALIITMKYSPIVPLNLFSPPSINFPLTKTIRYSGRETSCHRRPKSGRNNLLRSTRFYAHCCAFTIKNYLNKQTNIFPFFSKKYIEWVPRHRPRSAFSVQCMLREASSSVARCYCRSKDAQEYYAELLAYRFLAVAITFSLGILVHKRFSKFLTRPRVLLLEIIMLLIMWPMGNRFFPIPSFSSLHLYSNSNDVTPI